MRLARESFWGCAQTGAAAMTTKTARHKTERMVRFIRSSLNDIGVQLVMVGPESLGCIVQEFVRIFPRSGKTLQDASLQHVLGAVAFPNLLPHARPNLFHHVALGLEFGFRQDGTIGRHDPGLLIAEPKNDVHRVHAPSDPRSRE